MRLAIVLLIALAAWSFPARADDSADWQTCDGNSSPSSINACTRIILRGESSVSDLSVAYSNRGLSRAKNGNNDIGLRISNRRSISRYPPHSQAASVWRW